MKNANLLVVLVVGLVLGLIVGRMTLDGRDAAPQKDETKTFASGTPDRSPEAKSAAQSSEPIYKVDNLKGGWVKGPDDAIVTIVEFSNFQCGFCARVQDTIAELMEEYEDEVRLVYMQMAMPNMPRAAPAAQAAEAAGAQGKFWEYKDKLFQDTRSLDRDTFERYARELGLDMERFRSDLDDEVHKAKVDELLARGQALGVSGTPAFFINGRSLVGAQPANAFKEVIDAEIERAKAVLEAGVSHEDLYPTLVAGGAESIRPEAPERERPSRPSTPSFGRASADNAHVKGPDDALVTIVEFSNVQCGFCARVRPTIERIKREYGDQVRFVYKHQARPGAAHLAAQAGEAAGEQGKFFEYMDKVYENRRQLEREHLEAHARELGLDMDRFRSALDEERFVRRIDEHRSEAIRIGARGTPTFFINGRYLAGAQPFERFKEVIDEEMELAKRLIGEGVALGQLYERILDENEKKLGAEAIPPIRPAVQDLRPLPQQERPQPRESEPRREKPRQDEDDRVDVDTSSAIFKGEMNAPVTIVEFSNFACGFCGRVQPTIEQLMNEYEGKVRLAFMHRPQNPASTLAAEATMAAKDQGKFWEYHGLLFENMGRIGRPDLERHAETIDLDMDKFRKALDEREFKDEVEKHNAIAVRAGARGTPTFFINGRRLLGAQPIQNFKEIIDEELAATR